MLSCAFFGHRDYQYGGYRDKLEDAIRYLIDIGVTEFYSGNRGAFDRLCAHTVWNLKDEYPEIKNILVLSYYPDTKFKLPEWYDDAVYLLDKSVPPRYAISHTNRKLAQTVSYIIVGIAHKYGGAWSVYQYAKKHYYPTYNILTNEDDFFCQPSQREIDKIVREHQEMLAHDEEYRKDYEEQCLRIRERVELIFEKQLKKLKRKKTREVEPPVWVSVTQKKETTDF